MHSQAYGGPVPAPGRCLAAPIIILLQGEEKKEKNTLACLCVSKPITARGGGGGGVTVPLQNRVRGTCFDETFTHGEARSE